MIPNEGSVKQYISLLTQSGTGAPTATVLKNTFDASIVWSRDSQGTYIGTLTGAFKTGKTTINISLTNEGGITIPAAATNTENTIIIQTLDYTFSVQDDLLLNTPVTITVYN